MTPLIKFHNEKYGTDNVYADVISYKLTELWKTNDGEDFRRVEEFYRTPEFRNMTPLLGVEDLVKEISQNHSIKVLTARSKTTERHTRNWIEKYFPGMFSEVAFSTKFWDGSGKSKAEICQDWQTDLIIEDNLEFITECAESGIRGILVDQPWNQRETLHLNIQRVNHVTDARNIIESLTQNP